MKEVLLNGYLKIEPAEVSDFVASEKTSYEEIGKVVAKDDTITDIPIGSLVFFDSFMAKKYPIEGKFGRFQWYIHYSECVKCEYEDKEISK